MLVVYVLNFSTVVFVDSRSAKLAAGPLARRIYVVEDLMAMCRVKSLQDFKWHGSSFGFDRHNSRGARGKAMYNLITID